MLAAPGHPGGRSRPRLIALLAYDTQPDTDSSELLKLVRYGRAAEVAMWIGEAFVGEGAEAAHVNTVLGSRDGPVGTAWVTALATPSAGHAPFVALLRPGVPVQPMTLFVNKAAIAGEGHGRLTWGAAQAGVAGGVADAVAGSGDRRRRGRPTLVLIVAVWVDPEAADEEAVYVNNRAATLGALTAGREGAPGLDQVAWRRGTSPPTRSLPILKLLRFVTPGVTSRSNFGGQTGIVSAAVMPELTSPPISGSCWSTPSLKTMSVSRDDWARFATLCS